PCVGRTGRRRHSAGRRGGLLRGRARSAARRACPGRNRARVRRRRSNPAHLRQQLPVQPRRRAAGAGRRLPRARHAGRDLFQERDRPGADRGVGGARGGRAAAGPQGRHHGAAGAGPGQPRRPESLRSTRRGGASRRGRPPRRRADDRGRRDGTGGAQRLGRQPPPSAGAARAGRHAHEGGWLSRPPCHNETGQLRLAGPALAFGRAAGENGWNMSNVTLHFVDYFIIVASLVVSVAVGLRFARRQSTTSRYFSAGGNVPSWAIGMSIFATLVSSVTFLAYPGDGFANDWVRLVQGLMVPIVVLAGIGFIVPLYRKVIGLSAYEYFEKRFGYFARLYSSLGFVLAHFSKMGSVFFLLALALTGMTGVDTYTVIWVLGAAIVLLTLVGGMEAVIWLDVIQGFLLIVGGLIALLVIVLNVDGGLVTVFTVAAADRKMSLGSLDWDFVNLTFWVMAINGIFYAIQKYGTDQTIVQRYLTARSDREAIRASVAGVLVTVPVWTLFMFIGTALYVFYQGGTALPEGLRSDAVFPHFIMTELPVGVVGLIIAALMAAAI